MYLDPKATTKEHKEANKKTLQLAETIRAQRQVEAQNGIYGFRSNQKMRGSFLAYMRLLAAKKGDGPGNYRNWNSVIRHLEVFSSADITFGEVDRQFVARFREYLDKDATSTFGTKLAQNTKALYFSKVKTALRQAVKDEILTTNPCEGVDGFRHGETERGFLTLEELQALVKTPCAFPQLRAPFLFSCLTGLRWSDIEKLVWREVQYSTEMGHYIRFRQKKTQGTETLPITDQAFALLGERRDPTAHVFENLKYSNWNNRKLRQWVAQAGITKKVTFHCARHTYATLQLTLGTDIYTVSKLLGHRDLKTTQVYAKIIDDKKREAANRIQLDF